MKVDEMLRRDLVGIINECRRVMEQAELELAVLCGKKHRAPEPDIYSVTLKSKEEIERDNELRMAYERGCEDNSRKFTSKNPHPLVNALREAINDRSFVDTDGDVHYCPALTADEIESVIAKWEKTSTTPRAPEYACEPDKEFSAAPLSQYGKRKFEVSEKQLYALIQGWTHTDLMDEKPILQTICDQFCTCQHIPEPALRCNCEPRANGDDNVPEMCKKCTPEAYQRDGCSCLDMHDAALIKSVREVYEKFKHLDKPLSDPDLTGDESDFRGFVAGKLWAAIKETPGIEQRSES
jgi:hypothetical protein